MNHSVTPGWQKVIHYVTNPPAMVRSDMSYRTAKLYYLTQISSHSLVFFIHSDSVQTEAKSSVCFMIWKKGWNTKLQFCACVLQAPPSSAEAQEESVWKETWLRVMAHSSDPSRRETTPGPQGSHSAARHLLRKKEQRRRGIRSSSPMGRVILINSPVDGELLWSLLTVAHHSTPDWGSICLVQGIMGQSAYSRDLISSPSLALHKCYRLPSSANDYTVSFTFSICQTEAPHAFCRRGWLWGYPHSHGG